MLEAAAPPLLDPPRVNAAAVGLLKRSGLNHPPAFPGPDLLRRDPEVAPDTRVGRKVSRTAPVLLSPVGSKARATARGGGVESVM
jgi:hypothetical protein